MAPYQVLMRGPVDGREAPDPTGDGDGDGGDGGWESRRCVRQCSPGSPLYACRGPSAGPLPPGPSAAASTRTYRVAEEEGWC